MLDDYFKIRYKTIPIAISEQKDFGITELHNHSEFEILCITDGSSVVRVGDREYTVSKGDTVFINPMEIHSVTADTSRPYGHRCICFDCKILMNGTLAENLKNEIVCIRHHIKGDKRLCQLFENAFDVVKKEDKTFEMEASSYITLMFAYLLKNNLTDKENANNKNSDFCKKVLEYVSEHFAENISSKHAADALSFNQSYFCRNFKKNFGTSFAEYLNMYRVSASRGLLEDKTKSITQIAYECGFGTSSRFSKCFKKHYGILPSEYKK